MSFLHIDIPSLLLTTGYVGVTAIVFAESGLFFGFFLPGDSLLFSAGLLASQGYFAIGLLCIFIPVAAILGDSVGYWFGAKVGSALFTRDDSFFFRKRHVERTREFYEKHGPYAVVLARFMPIIRTFAPILAGVGSMRYRIFLMYNVIGGAGWSLLLLSAGFFLGRSFPQLQNYLLPISIGIIVVSVLPLAREFFRSR